MSYKIRYDFGRRRQNPTKQILRVQCVISGVMAVLLCLIRFGRGGEMLMGLLSVQPETIGERAVSALSLALARGEGWYQALAVWCRTIIDGAAV